MRSADSITGNTGTYSVRHLLSWDFRSQVYRIRWPRRPQRRAQWTIDFEQRHDTHCKGNIDFHRDVLGETLITEPEPAECVKWLLRRQQRAVLARQPSGTFFNLPIEKGRYRNIDEVHRLCQQCDMDTVETASYFLHSCPTYHIIRQMYIDDDICTNIDFNMPFSDGRTTRRASSYILKHYNDVIKDAIASQITRFAVVYPIVYSDADQRKHQSSRSWPLFPGDRWIPRTNGQ